MLYFLKPYYKIGCKIKNKITQNQAHRYKDWWLPERGAGEGLGEREKKIIIFINTTFLYKRNSGFSKLSHRHSSKC